MEDNQLSEQGQKALFIKVNALRQEIADFTPLSVDKELAMRIATNVQESNRHIARLENRLADCVSMQGLNEAIGFNLPN